MNYWLMKTEPTCFSIDDLAKAPHQTTCWDGVRNYQARNFMRDQMCVGDLVFFYHSNCSVPGIAGIAEVVREAYPDHTAFDPLSEHPDLTSSIEHPRWFMVDVRLVEKFEKIIPLVMLKHYPELADMLLLRKGNRLSVLPVSEKQWNFICQNVLTHLSENF
jgi:predicted RNA-binding protein with PUA-like domain